jgi:hypothetical protein
LSDIIRITIRTITVIRIENPRLDGADYKSAPAWEKGLIDIEFA